VFHYEYGAEAATVLAMVNALSAKRPDLGKGAPSPRDLNTMAQAFAEAQNAVVIYGSEGLGLAGSQALAQACANLLIVTNHIGRPNNGLIAVWGEGNGQGVWDMGLRPVTDLRAAIEAAKALYIVAADPAGDELALAAPIQRAGFLVVQELFLTETARMADVVLPAQSFTEREGTYTSGERRVQHFYPAVQPQGQARPDYAIIAQIGRLLGLALEDRSALLVMDRQIATHLPDYAGVTYRKLAEVVEQWPIIGRADLYYGGTSYSNSQGLGVQLLPAAQRGEPVALGWIRPPAREPNGLLAAPITRLYDRARTVLSSRMLLGRIPAPYVVMNPADAGRLGIEAGSLVEVRFGGAENQVVPDVTVRLDEQAPPGVLLVPRSMGMPVRGLEKVEMVAQPKVVEA
jgi:NADH-quinone oxidoreductase subunit G